MAKMDVWANMPVKDIEKTHRFFKQLGFKVNGPHESNEVASFIFSEDHFVIHFFEYDRFAQNVGNTVSNPPVGSEILFTLAAESKVVVDQWRAKVVEAGGTIIIEPTEISEGYNLVFADLNGHRWNVFYRKPQ